AAPPSTTPAAVMPAPAVLKKSRRSMDRYSPHPCVARHGESSGRLGWGVPYRLDVPGDGNDAFDRLIELGAFDADRLPDGRVAAVMPDSVTSEQIARALGLGAEHVSVSPVSARDAGSVWVLGLRAVRAGRLRIVP